jgi:cytidylate kinase
MTPLEKQIATRLALWKAEDLAAREQRPGRGKVGELSWGPYVLVSRAKGSGGHTVAQKIGERLGWPVFDHQIVEEIARRANVRQQLVESLDEHDRTVLDDLIQPLIDSEDIGTAGYTRYLRQVVLTLGHQGNVVIVGRAARHVLPTQFGLNVRLVAPLELRVQRIAAERGLTLKAAKSEVLQADRERAALVQREFKHQVDDPLNYDLTINTGELSIEACSGIVLRALHEKLGVQPPGNT